MPFSWKEKEKEQSPAVLWSFLSGRLVSWDLVFETAQWPCWGAICTLRPGIVIRIACRCQSQRQYSLPFRVTIFFTHKSGHSASQAQLYLWDNNETVFKFKTVLENLRSLSAWSYLLLICWMSLELWKKGKNKWVIKIMFSYIRYFNFDPFYIIMQYILYNYISYKPLIDYKNKIKMYFEKLYMCQLQ